MDDNEAVNSLDNIVAGLNEDADSDLIEIFNRRYAIFNETPMELQNDTLDRFNELFSSENIIRYLKMRDMERRVVYISWYYLCLPLPVLNLKEIKRRFLIRLAFSQFAKFAYRVATLLVKLVERLLITVVMLMQFNGLIRRMASFSNWFAYSNNVFKDVYTFIFEGNRDLIQRYEEVLNHDGDVFYFENEAAFKNITTWETMRVAFYNSCAMFLNANCTKSTDTNCKIESNALVFKFSDVIKEFFPLFRENGKTIALKLVTVGLYLIYLLGGNVIFLNMLFFSSSIMIQKFFEYKDIFDLLRKLVWNSLGSM